MISCVLPARDASSTVVRALSSVLAEACVEKFGGDSLEETRRNFGSYLASIPAGMRSW